MPNIKSAEKRMRQNAVRNEANRAQRSALRTAIKKTRDVIATGDAQAAEKQMPATTSIIAKMAQKGQIHKNKAARQTSRLARAANALKASAS